MPKKIRYITAIFLLVVFPMTMVGFTVYHHICGMSGNTIVSVFVPKSCCCDEPAKDESQEVAEAGSMSCCAQSAPVIDNSSPSIQDDDGCKIFSEYRVLNVPFVSSEQVTVSHSVLNTFFIAITSSLLSNTNDVVNKTYNLVTHEIVLPTSGILRCISFISRSKVSEDDTF